MTRTLVFAAIGAIVMTVSALAQNQGSGSGAHMQQKDHPKGSMMGKGKGSGAAAGSGSGAHAEHAAKGDTGPSSKAFLAANDKMHADMNIVFTGNADVDFVRGMIPHHQGAIDMAKVVQAHGKDAQIRKLAEDIIKAQESEIAMMNDWLAKNAK